METYLDAILQILAIAASVAAVILTNRETRSELRTTLEESERWRQDDRYYTAEQEASLVHAWVVADGGNRWFVLLHNGTRSPLRRVHIDVMWPDKDDANNLKLIPARERNRGRSFRQDTGFSGTTTTRTRGTSQSRSRETTPTPIPRSSTLGRRARGRGRPARGSPT